MKSISIIMLCILIAPINCGRISNDGYSSYSGKTDFGYFGINVQPHRSGIILITYGPPYDLLMSFYFKPKIRSAKISSITIDYLNQPDSLKQFDNIYLPVSPNPGDSHVYYRLNNVFPEYEEVIINIEMELLENSGTQKTYNHTEKLHKQPTSRWWFFFELV